MNHVIAGIGVSIVGDVAFPEHLNRLYARCDDPTEITLQLRAERSSAPHRPAGQPTIETDSWVAFVDGDTVQICGKDATRETPEAMRIELARDGLEGRYLHDDGWPYCLQYPIDQLLVVHALRIAGGALMHAASIAGRDGAVLVAGPSGAGKTTMSNAAAALGGHVLSDERSIVRPIADGSWVVGGTPWPGEGGYNENRSVPLRALILLEQSDRDEFVPLSSARALALLYRCHFPPLWDARACERTVANLERLVGALPAFLFRNRKGPEAARMLLERVGGAG
ncbi:MAG TPA: hypothetical protein VF997_18390 [Polyangia bacterium]